MLTPARIEAMFKRTGGIEVTLGATTTWGHRDIVDQTLFEDGTPVIATVDTVKVATGILSGLAEYAAITVNGESLMVADAQKIGDGSITQIELEVP